MLVAGSQLARTDARWFVGDGAASFTRTSQPRVVSLAAICRVQLMNWTTWISSVVPPAWFSFSIGQFAIPFFLPEEFQKTRLEHWHFMQIVQHVHPEMRCIDLHSVRPCHFHSTGAGAGAFGRWRGWACTGHEGGIDMESTMSAATIETSLSYARWTFENVFKFSGC